MFIYPFPTTMKQSYEMDRFSFWTELKIRDTFFFWNLRNSYGDHGGYSSFPITRLLLWDDPLVSVFGVFGSNMNTLW